MSWSFKILITSIISSVLIKVFTVNFINSSDVKFISLLFILSIHSLNLFIFLSFFKSYNILPIGYSLLLFRPKLCISSKSLFCSFFCNPSIILLRVDLLAIPLKFIPDFFSIINISTNSSVFVLLLISSFKFVFLYFFQNSILFTTVSSYNTFGILLIAIFVCSSDNISLNFSSWFFKYSSIKFSISSFSISLACSNKPEFNNKSFATVYLLFSIPICSKTDSIFFLTSISNGISPSTSLYIFWSFSVISCGIFPSFSNTSKASVKNIASVIFVSFAFCFAKLGISPSCCGICFKIFFPSSSSVVAVIVSDINPSAISSCIKNLSISFGINNLFLYSLGFFFIPKSFLACRLFNI